MAVSLPVSVELNGKTYNGTYTVARGMITVTSVWGTKTTQVGNMPVEMLAKMLLSEIVHQANM